MRPRPEGRGEPTTSCGPRARCEMLQCGHDPKAVENRGHDPRTSRRPPRFNAATTRRPWRTHPRDQAVAASLKASMRPRPEGRGELFGRRQPHAPIIELQCGHDPKAVENTEKEPNTSSSWALQCGHDPKAVENKIQKDGLTLIFHASMRPRPEGRGERRRRRRSPSKDSRLQCGHDPKAVENRTSAATLRTGTRRLQCGHDPKAVENGANAAGWGRLVWASMRPRPEGRGELRDLVDVGTRDGGFNAATTRRPWRTVLLAKPPARMETVLQCGHDPKAVENRYP